MSKSRGAQQPGHAIGLADPPDVIRRAIMRAVTDLGQETRFAHATPGVHNLLVIYEILSGQDRAAVETRFAGQGYGALKREVADLVIAMLEPIQQRYAQLMAEPDYVEQVLAGGAERAQARANITHARAREHMGVG